MIKFDEAENKLFTARAALDQVVADLEQRNHKLNIEQETLSQEVVRLEAERGAASATIDKNSLDQYNNLRKSRKGVAVAKVTGKNCSACGSTLSAALQQAARSPNEINFCDTCGRILYSG
jgi:predicted  nucleic acid-binding Zn-ribbon protein